MKQPFVLAPRYRLDDESIWLEGIDPARHYWIAVNGENSLKVAIPGLTVSCITEWKQSVRKFRALQPGQQMDLLRAANACSIHCISENCYAIASEIQGFPVWHLFDAEALENLLRTGHPDWQFSPKDIDLGRQIIWRSFQQATELHESFINKTF
ncbi:hypothetical protein [Aerosakkonema funiforme]|uniref:Uncharacterized protein n=2 Tax=Oscillatoriophycideae TaxID=1301283 RepID=A0A926VJI6_9CYAN|nr:hypothetical protein [Aerosakkonema funiforme]MBD2184828.1 hypothetical protein [Aerosakkonema funiforme FACHB-1375]